MSEFIHIVSFDVPYPANYGGVIDVFYKIKSLHEAGIKVILHCFLYNDKSEAEELEKICHKVFYYKRNTKLSAHFSYLPYTVFSRKNAELLSRLKSDNYPILFEGLMSCYYLNHPALRAKVRFVRECNIEHSYYFQLFKTTTSFNKSLFYLLESFKLLAFERNIKNASSVFAISESEKAELKSRYPKQEIIFMPCFHSNEKINIQPGKSDYIMYHGNLSVIENELAATFLAEKVFSKLPYKCIIAGMNPSDKLKQLVHTISNITLIANPDEKRMTELIQNAQINILITNQTTGLKIKLLNALFSGRHIIVNTGILKGSGLDEICNIANSDEELIRYCHSLMNQEFSKEMIVKREHHLLPLYSNQFQAQYIITELHKH